MFTIHFLPPSVMFVRPTLLLTLPVIVATFDCSFSKLKLIKNFVQSTMSSERLSDLAVLPIENHHAKQLDSLVLLTLLNKRRHENGSLTNDVDISVMAYSL